MYKNISGYVHRLVEPWTGVRVPQGNRHSVPNHIPSLGPTSSVVCRYRGSDTTHGPAQTGPWTLAKGEVFQPAKGALRETKTLQSQLMMGCHAALMAGPNSPLIRRYGPAIKFGAENGLFHPTPTMAQKSPKLTPQPGHTRAGAKQQTLYPSSTKLLAALCNLVPQDSLTSWRHRVATEVRMPNSAKLAISGGRPVLAFMAILSSQALIHAPWYPLWSRASGFGFMFRWLLAVPRGDGRATGQKRLLGCRARCASLPDRNKKIRKIRREKFSK